MVFECNKVFTGCHKLGVEYAEYITRWDYAVGWTFISSQNSHSDTLHNNVMLFPLIIHTLTSNPSAQWYLAMNFFLREEIKIRWGHEDRAPIVALRKRLEIVYFFLLGEFGVSEPHRSNCTYLWLLLQWAEVQAEANYKFLDLGSCLTLAVEVF